MSSIFSIFSTNTTGAFGSTQNIILIGILIFIVYHVYTNYASSSQESFGEVVSQGFLTLRNFTGLRPIVTPEQYYQDIRVISSYVGPYIGDIYLYMRGRYFDPAMDKTLPPFYKPETVDDPTLKDPLLPIARSQIKAWIDSSKSQIVDRYGADFVKKNASMADIYYVETPEKVLKVTYTENGKAETFLI